MQDAATNEMYLQFSVQASIFEGEISYQLYALVLSIILKCRKKDCLIVRGVRSFSFEGALLGERLLSNSKLRDEEQFEAGINPSAW
jgi:hypothetical protein